MCAPRVSHAANGRAYGQRPLLARWTGRAGEAGEVGHGPSRLVPKRKRVGDAETLPPDDAGNAD